MTADEARKVLVTLKRLLIHRRFLSPQSTDAVTAGCGRRDFDRE